MDAEAAESPLVLIPLVCLVIVVSACGGTTHREGAKVKYSSETKQADCSLRAGIAFRDASKLVVDYEFHNGSALTAFVFDRFWRDVQQGAGFLVIDGGSWVELREHEASLSAKLIPVPHGVLVEKPHLSLVTRVEPGVRHVGRLEASLPLRHQTPYDEGAAGPVRPRALWLELGYFLARADGAALVKHVKTSQGPGLQFDPFPTTGQNILRVGPLHKSIATFESRGSVP